MYLSHLRGRVQFLMRAGSEAGQCKNGDGEIRHGILSFVLRETAHLSMA